MTDTRKQSPEKIWDELTRIKTMLIEDIRGSIEYKPDRTVDLLAFMHLYIKAEVRERPAILESLRSCMDGRPYPNPYACYYCYTEKDIAACDCLLDEYMESIGSLQIESCDPKQVRDQAVSVMEKIRRLNESCGFGLLDEWRVNMLDQLIELGVALADLKASQDHAMDQRM